MSFPLIIFFLTACFINLAQANPASCPGGKVQHYQVCYFSLNNDKESGALKQFIENITLPECKKITVKEFIEQKTDKSAEILFTEMVKEVVSSGSHCDGLVISGHHTGSFFGERASESLPIQLIEDLSCHEETRAFFENVQALWLQGCNTSGDTTARGRMAVDQRTSSAGSHIAREGLGRDFAEISQSYAATLDTENPISSRYLRAFPSAVEFGWTGSAPGESKHSENSIPYHVAHLAKLIEGGAIINHDPMAPDLTLTEKYRYGMALVQMLNRPPSLYARLCEARIAESWISHGNPVKGEYGFDNQEIASFISLEQDQDKQNLKLIRDAGCLLRSRSTEEEIMRGLGIILSSKKNVAIGIGPIMALVADSTSPEVLGRLRENKILEVFLLEKINSSKESILNRLGYYKFMIQGLEKNPDPKIEKMLNAIILSEFSKVVSSSAEEFHQGLLRGMIRQWSEIGRFDEAMLMKIMSLKIPASRKKLLFQEALALELSFSNDQSLVGLLEKFAPKDIDEARLMIEQVIERCDKDNNIVQERIRKVAMRYESDPRATEVFIGYGEKSGNWLKPRDELYAKALSTDDLESFLDTTDAYMKASVLTPDAKVLLHSWMKKTAVSEADKIRSSYLTVKAIASYPELARDLSWELAQQHLEIYSEGHGLLSIDEAYLKAMIASCPSAQACLRMAKDIDERFTIQGKSLTEVIRWKLIERSPPHSDLFQAFMNIVPMEQALAGGLVLKVLNNGIDLTGFSQWFKQQSFPPPIKSQFIDQVLGNPERVILLNSVNGSENLYFECLSDMRENNSPGPHFKARVGEFLSLPSTPNKIKAEVLRAMFQNSFFYRGNWTDVQNFDAWTYEKGDTSNNEPGKGKLMMFYQNGSSPCSDCLDAYFTSKYFVANSYLHVHSQLLIKAVSPMMSLGNPGKVFTEMGRECLMREGLDSTDCMLVMGVAIESKSIEAQKAMVDYMASIVKKIPANKIVSFSVGDSFVNSAMDWVRNNKLDPKLKLQLIEGSGPFIGPKPHL